MKLLFLILHVALGALMLTAGLAFAAAVLAAIFVGLFSPQVLHVSPLPPRYNGRRPVAPDGHRLPRVPIVSASVPTLRALRWALQTVRSGGQCRKARESTYSHTRATPGCRSTSLTSGFRLSAPRPWWSTYGFPATPGAVSSTAARSGCPRSRPEPG